MRNFLSNFNLSKVIILDLILLLLAFIFCFNIVFVNLLTIGIGDNGNEFSLLADAFLHSRLDITKYSFAQTDCSVVDNKCYWGQGPFPGVILMPFVFLFNLISLPFFQGYLHFFLVLGVFYLCYLLAKKTAYSQADSLWLALAFCFGSVYFGVAVNSQSWYFAQTVAVGLLFLAVYEFFNKKRYWLIGLYFAFIWATRCTAGLGILFFVFAALFDRQLDWRAKIKQLIFLFGPVFFSGLILFYYNYVRFGNLFDLGYERALTGGVQQIMKSRFGLFSLHYFVTNFYYYFLKLPDPVLWQNYLLVPPYFFVNPLGLSFFAISPLFLKIFWAKPKDRLVIFAWIVSLLILLIILLYHNSGWWQLGPRYILDFLPFWFLILLFSFKNRQLKTSHRLVIGISSLVNFFFVINIFRYSF